MSDKLIEIKEVAEAVRKINTEVFKDHDFEGDYFSILDLHTDGEVMIVTFFDSYRVWSSYEDERNFSKEKNEWEPIGGFLRRTTQRILDKLGSIKIKDSD